MAQANRITVGFVTPVSASSPHFEPFRALIPEAVRLDFEGLGIVRGSLDDLRGTAATVIERAGDLVKKRGWKGVIVSGAPLELLNPGLLDGLRAALEVPVTTALDSCVAALKSFSARRVLLMTPFDEPMNRRIRDYLTNRGIDAISPRQTLAHYTDATKLTPEQVYSMTEQAFREAGSVQAVYFQGAVLDPIKVLERMERELGTTVVASNPAMLWCILSRLGLRLGASGWGRLLSEWPDLAES